MVLFVQFRKILSNNGELYCLNIDESTLIIYEGTRTFLNRFISS